MQYKKRKIGKKNKRNKRGGADTFTFKNHGAFVDGKFNTQANLGHADTTNALNNTEKPVSKLVIGGIGGGIIISIVIGIWLMSKFKK